MSACVCGFDGFYVLSINLLCLTLYGLKVVADPESTGPVRFELNEMLDVAHWDLVLGFRFVELRGQGRRLFSGSCASLLSNHRGLRSA